MPNILLVAMIETFASPPLPPASFALLASSGNISSAGRSHSIELRPRQLLLPLPLAGLAHRLTTRAASPGAFAPGG